MVNDRITVDALEARWQKALTATLEAVRRQPEAYCSLKTLMTDIVGHPLDISDYMPTLKTLVGLLKTLDPHGRGSIFHHFETRISTTDAWQVNLLRMECTDLMAHLDAFDEWRSNTRPLKIVK